MFYPTLIKWEELLHWKQIHSSYLVERFLCCDQLLFCLKIINALWRQYRNLIFDFCERVLIILMKRYFNFLIWMVTYISIILIILSENFLLYFWFIYLFFFFNREEKTKKKDNGCSYETYCFVLTIFISVIIITEY